MLTPEKHTRISESLFGLGAEIMRYLDEERSPENIYTKLNNDGYMTSHSFASMILAIDYLYACNLVELNIRGNIQKCD